MPVGRGAGIAWHASKRGDGRDTIVHCNTDAWACRLHIDQQPLHVERTAATAAPAGGRRRGAAAVSRRAADRAPRPDDTGGERGCFADRRCCAGRVARMREPVVQDQLLAESEAAVPAEMVREFQVAGLRGCDAQPLNRSCAGLTRASLMQLNVCETYERPTFGRGLMDCRVKPGNDT